MVDRCGKSVMPNGNDKEKVWERKCIKNLTIKTIKILGLQTLKPIHTTCSGIENKRVKPTQFLMGRV